jgi:tetratricopeptide (TPR) repeat protein
MEYAAMIIRSSIRAWLLTGACGVAALTGCQSQRPIHSVRSSGDYQYQQGNYAAAADEYSEIVSRFPGDWEAQYRLGLSHLELGQLAPARRALDIANTLKPENQDVADALAEVMFQQKDEARLFAFLKSRAETYQTVAAHLAFAKYAEEMGDKDTARLALDTAIEVDNASTSEPYYQYALYAERLGDLDLAIRRLRQGYGINMLDRRILIKLQELGETVAPEIALPPGR